ncbi:MAG: class I SAM-dependent methyltransferase [Gammaproteobacteria bacterium]|nr:class I SAM-dependent methyltransferase [Gammaproteobacteria bacterium]
MFSKTSLLFALCALISLSAPTHAGDTADAINKIANGEHRSDKYKARNQFRNPGETLEFFGIRPDMTVVELSPGGGGWYTEILAPYLRESGTYYAGSYDPESTSEYSQRNMARYAEKLAKHPELYDRAKVTTFAPPDKMEAAPAGSADMVLTFRNMHSWMRRGTQEAMMQAAYSYLKPGGVLGVVAHRGDPDKPQDPKASKGYIQQDIIVQLAESAGFVLEASSEINANPKDTRDHPQGVWNLPPGFRDGDTDRAKYAAIGESDRMTLRFRKP